MFHRFEFFRDLYLHELARQQSISQSMSATISGTTLASGVLGYVLIQFKFDAIAIITLGVALLLYYIDYRLGQ